MPQKDPSELFDEAHAASYDERFIRLAPLRQTLDLLMRAILFNEPPGAHVLCVGAGTGSEVIELAEAFPDWRFTLVEPSAPMLEVCRRRLGEKNLTDRCHLHGGFLDTLPPSGPFDVATSILVSQFITSQEARADFFRGIASRLRPGGILINADLACDPGTPDYRSRLEVWMRFMKGAGVSAEDVENLYQAYEKDVALLPPRQIGGIIAANGFETPVPFFQAGLIHGWYARLAAAEANPTSP